MDNAALVPLRRQGEGMRVLAVLVLLVGLVWPAAPAAPVSNTQPPRVRAEVVEGLAVLHAWDERRARAWAAADERALRSLYVAGSAAARADIALLRSYTARRLVVRRIVTQVFGVVVLRRSDDRLVLRVRDRVASGTVLDHGREVALPSTPPVVRRLELRRVEGTWLLAAG